MREILLKIYQEVFNFFTIDLSVSAGLSKMLAVIAVIVAVVLVIRLAIGILRWIGITI